MSLFRMQVQIRSNGLEQVGELSARLTNFIVPFGEIVGEWAGGNRFKFALGKGAEDTGVDQAPARWAPLKKYMGRKSPYQERKRKQGYPNHLMVRTGELWRSQTSRGTFAEMIEPLRVVFGAPMDAENRAKVIGNRETRPVVFLSRGDRNMIRRNLSNYLNMGEKYKKIMFSAAARRYAIKQEVIEMDARFAEAMA